MPTSPDREDVQEEIRTELEEYSYYLAYGDVDQVQQAGSTGDHPDRPERRHGVPGLEAIAASILVYILGSFCEQWGTALGRESINRVRSLLGWEESDPSTDLLEEADREELEAKADEIIVILRENTGDTEELPEIDSEELKIHLTEYGLTERKAEELAETLVPVLTTYLEDTIEE